MVENQLHLKSDLIILTKEKVDNTSDDISVNDSSSDIKQQKNYEIFTENWPLNQTLASIKNINKKILCILGANRKLNLIKRLMFY